MENLNVITDDLFEQMLASAHTLIAGATGCGKSVFIHNAIVRLLSKPLDDVEMILIDLKGGLELCDYEDLPHVKRFADNVQSALDALDLAIGIMERRRQAMRPLKQKMFYGRDVYVIIDEMGFLLQNARKQALPKLITLSQQGRASRVHLICATQNPGRSQKYGIPAEVQQNFTFKVALHCTTAIESRAIISVAGAELLPKHGKALVWSEGYVTKEDVPMINEDAKQEAIAHSRSVGGNILRMRAN